MLETPVSTFFPNKKRVSSFDNTLFLFFLIAVSIVSAIY